jgi:hypothetical protein
MKKLAMVLMLALLSYGVSTSTADAATAKAQDNTGCGLGSALIQDNDSLLAQLAMTLLNSTLGNQTFGMTSGTSNCKQATNFVSNELQRFVEANMDVLASDIAMGEGESLDTLAELMEIPTADRVEFKSTLQANFSDIYVSENVDAAGVIDNIITVTS